MKKALIHLYDMCPGFWVHIAIVGQRLSLSQR